MVPIISILNFKRIMLVMSIFMALTASAQLGKSENQASNNTYGIENHIWASYLNKTNLLLEKVDAESFLNYVIMANDGNFSDRKYFVEYVRVKINKDKAELIFKVGNGIIKTAEEVKAFYSSLQPKYSLYFQDFKQRREEIIETLDNNRAPGAGTPVPFNCGSPCTNPGFESGTGFWDYWTGTACASSTSDPCGLVSGFDPAQHVLQTIGTYDATVGGTILPVVPPGGGSNSLMLGNGPINGAQAARASISFTVSAANANFTYKYACILQDPVSGHTDPERPYFSVRIRDASGNIVTCGDYFVMAKPPIVGFTETFAGSAVWYRNWTTVFVPLSSYIGQCITVEFTSSDCSQGGHYGYAYIDADCDPLQVVTSSPSVCGGNNVILTAPAGGASYDWTNTAGGTTGIIGSTTNQTVTVNQGGTYQVVITSVAGPTCTTTLNITVGTSPASPVASFTNTTACSGNPTVFTDTSTPVGSIDAWSWDFNNDGVEDSNLQNPSNIFAGSGTYPVTLIVSWGPCNSTITQNIIVTGPTLVITNPPAVCSPGTVDITTPAVTAGSTGGGTLSYWNDLAATSALATPTAIVTSGTYYIKVTATGGCTDIDPVVVTINPLPISDAGLDVAVCSGGVAGIGTTATAGYTYSWTPTTGLSSATVSNPSNTTTNSGTTPIVTNYTVTTTITITGCQSTDLSTITVNPLPVLTITNPPGVCTPGTVDITAPTVTVGSTGGGTLSYWNDAAATSALATPTAIATSGTYYIKVTATGGCTDIDPVSVTINPLPVSTAGPDIELCTGGTGSIGGAAVSGYNYIWTPATGLSSTNVSNPTVTLINAGTSSYTTVYSVITTASATGCQSSASVNVTVDAVATANAGSAQYVCIGSGITLGGAVGGSATSGIWGGGSGTYSPNNTTLNAVYTPSAAEFAAGSVVLTLTTNDPTGPCTFASSNVTFYFYQNPVANFSVIDPSGCPLHCASFTDLSTIGGGDTIVEWAWSFGDTSPIDNVNQNPSHCYSLTGFYDVTLTVTSNHSCIGTLTMVHAVQVYAMPVAEFNPTPNPASVLDPTITLNDQSIAPAPAVINYWFWSFGDGDTLAPNTQNPVHLYPNDAPGIYNATLIVQNSDGCRDTISHEVIVGPEFTFYIPNAFTPNGDEVNDFFFGTGIGITKYDIWIFDRWGNMIYHSGDLNASHWDGRANKGVDVAQQDVYVWKVKLTDVFNKNHNYIGTVTLVK